ncbi:hypothetical protein [Helicobacter ganmani]|uniref:hypothetical protein n=1 Tax=Helicobacter ganmani TaxID=60246 RepID=UPI003A870084
MTFPYPSSERVCLALAYISHFKNIFWSSYLSAILLDKGATCAKGLFAKSAGR